jgi:hypothetical protein
VNPEELLNPDEKLVVEGHVFVGAASGMGIDTISVWNPRVDKVANLADYIEAAFGSEDNVGIYGPMRITIERMSS